MKIGKTKIEQSGNRYLAAYRKKKNRFNYQPASTKSSISSTDTHFNLVRYSKTSFEYRDFKEASALLQFLQKQSDATAAFYWIDMAGVASAGLKEIGQYFKIHKLLISDISTTGQRAKMDNMNDQLFALLPMLSYQKESGTIDSDQLCIVLSDRFVLSFHNAPAPDYFNFIKGKIQKGDSPIRNNKPDYLLYVILDVVVDHYFTVTQILSDQLDDLEDTVIEDPRQSHLLHFTLLRHKIMVAKRAIIPVRELMSQLWRTDNPTIAPASKNYFKDVYDHIALAVETIENYREIVANLQELYMNQVNTRMNEVMKTLTIITALVVPFTVISGIYGMNFEKIPFSPASGGFIAAILFMLALSALMLLYFKRKGWF